MKKILILVLILSYVSNCEKKEEKPNPIFLLPLISNLNTLNTYPQKTINEDLAISIDSTFSNIYNSNLAGTIGGIVNRTANCPLSGTVTITGTATTVNSVTTTNLVYTATNCSDTIKFASMTSTIAFTGTLTQTGVVNSTITRSSSSLALKGRQANTSYTIGTPIDWNTSCAVSITSTSTNYSGSVCDKTFSF